MEHKRPPLQKEISWTNIGNNIINFSTPPVGFQQYLVLGEDKAALIDTGMGIGSLKAVIEKITALPIIVINTHCHPDHAGGNYEFAPALINPTDLDVFQRMATLEFRQEDVAHMPNGAEFVPHLLPTGPEPVGVKDGEVIDLGGRQLHLIFTPGHTHGSLCVYEPATGILFTGDNVQANTTALKEWNSTTVEEFAESMEKLSKLNVTRILGGHRPNDNPPDLLTRKLECAKQILNGAKGVEKIIRGELCWEHEYEGTAIGYDPNRVYKK